MTYPGTPSPPSPDRTATVITSVIGAIALIAVVLIALITNDSTASSLAGRPDAGYGTEQGPDVSGGGSVGVEGGSGRASITTEAPDAPGESVVTDPGPAEPSTTSPASVPPVPSVSSSSATSTQAGAAQLRATFPTPPGTKKISAYGSVPKPGDEEWYLSTSSLAKVHAFYVELFKKSGWNTYIKPSVYKDSAGKVEGYFSIYHLHERVTADLSLDRNYLQKKPGTVLIRSGISDD